MLEVWIWENKEQDNRCIFAPRGRVDLRRTEKLPAPLPIPPQATQPVGASHLKRHRLHWSGGFICLNTPTMQRVTAIPGVIKAVGHWAFFPCCSVKSRHSTKHHRFSERGESPATECQTGGYPSAYGCVRVRAAVTMGWVGGMNTAKSGTLNSTAYRTKPSRYATSKIAHFRGAFPFPNLTAPGQRREQ